jgi:hypothetical protein
MFPRLLAISMAFGVGASAAQTPTPPPVDVAKLTISAPATIRGLDIKGVRGVPSRMAWSPDDKWIYVRLSSFDRWSNETVRHLLVEVAGKGVETLTDEPDWLARAWNIKAALASPAVPTWRITADSREGVVRTTNVPREGNLGMSVSDPSTSLEEVVANAALANQRTRTETLKLGGVTLDETVNERLWPGRTFGWAPSPLALIAYVTGKGGGLVIMNQHGQTQLVKGVKRALLPAWSTDGRRLGCIQQSGSGSYAIRVVDIR